VAKKICGGTKITKQRVSVKHIPQRTCVACRNVRSQHELMRLVRTSDGSVAVDVSGKKAGRGAYLCQARECWEIVLKGDRLGHALRTTVTQGNREQLDRYGENFCKGSVGDKSQ